MSVARPPFIEALDSWDQPASGSRPILRRPANETVPDDWDADEAEADDTVDAESNQKIWDHANTRVPMPNLVISPSQTSSSTPGLSALPSAAFQPPIRILKRSPASTNNNSTSSTSGDSTDSKSGSSFAEREARYQAARERIFGGNNSSGGGGGDKPQSDGVSVVRAPRGPSSANDSKSKKDDNGDRPPKGFAGRRNAPPPMANKATIQ